MAVSEHLLKKQNWYLNIEKIDFNKKFLADFYNRVDDEDWPILGLNSSNRLIIFCEGKKQWKDSNRKSKFA